MQPFGTLPPLFSQDIPNHLCIDTRQLLLVYLSFCQKHKILMFLYDENQLYPELEDGTKAYRASAPVQDQMTIIRTLFSLNHIPISLNSCF